MEKNRNKPVVADVDAHNMRERGQVHEPERPKLSDFLKAKLKENGRTLKRVAEGRGTGDSYSNVRAWFSRNAFPETGLMELIELAGMNERTVGELKNHFEFELIAPRHSSAVLPSD